MPLLSLLFLLSTNWLVLSTTYSSDFQERELFSQLAPNRRIFHACLPHASRGLNVFESGGWIEYIVKPPQPQKPWSGKALLEGNNAVGRYKRQT